MLDPSDRQVYWEPLAPPPGYELDIAVATTYSLDLQALMMAAVPMAFGALDVQEEGLPDQVQALASLQRVARRTTVFCQQAQIAAPGTYSRLFSLLEPVVAEVPAPRGGAFHPKMWLMRYTADGRDPRYRLVVLSRNLTLDRSWDAMFVADGWPGHTSRGYREPLADFIRTLPDLCVEPLDRARRSEIRALSRELDDVYFPRPEGFSQMRHAPIGIRGHTSLPSGWADRRLVISPFLADRTVTELLSEVGEGVLVSRAEALDGLAEETLEKLDHCRIYYWLDDVADEASDDEVEDATPGCEPDAGEALHGLHAKIIVSEQGDHSRLLVGSANATEAAFGNHNVEYCLQFTARREDFGIESIVPSELDEDDPAGRGLLNMLMPYERDDDFTPPPPDLTEEALREVREQLTALDLGLAIKSAGEDTWDQWIAPDEAGEDLPPATSVSCRPISLPQTEALRDASGLWRGEAVSFERVSLETLTTFVLFEITIGDKTKRLVMNLPLRKGSMPDQREDRLIALMIRDGEGFLRYLLMLLWEDEEADIGALGMNRWLSEGGRSRGGVETVPLLEELVRAFSRNPERLDDIEDLVRRLRTTDEGRAIVPDDFLQLWDAIEVARGDLDG
jgi:hypothetical protein